MSAEVQESGGKRGKSKQKKMTVRVDFTPMVDMNMLLITFFMLCTTLSKPQTMEISMPSNDKDITENQKSMVKASQAITLLLGADNKLYYYEGEPNYKDYTSLKETSYGADGLRAVLLQKNAVAVNKVFSRLLSPESTKCMTQVWLTYSRPRKCRASARSRKEPPAMSGQYLSLRNTSCLCTYVPSGRNLKASRNMPSLLSISSGVRE